MLSISRNYLRLFKFSIHNYNKSIQPEAKQRVHGRLLVDEFHYLKDRSLSKLQQFQTKNYQKHSQKWKDLSDKYWNTYSQRRDPRIDSPAQPYQKYQYYTRVNWIDERQYHIIHRKPIGADNSSSEVALDLMQIPQIKKYKKTFDLVRTAFSPSQNLICFGVDLHNNQNLQFYIRDLTNKKVHKEKFEGEVKDVVFCDDKSLYYLVEAEDKRAYQLYWKQLGDEKGELVYEENDPEYHLDFQKSKDGTCLLLSSANRTVSEFHLVTKTNEGIKMRKMLDKQTKSRGFMNKADKIYLWTDQDSYDFKIKVFDQQKQQFIEFYQLEEGVTINEVDLFQGYIVLYMRKHSKSFIRVIEIDTKNSHDVDLNQQVCMITPSMNPSYRTNKFMFSINTPFIYNQTYSYDISEKKLTKLNEFKLAGPKFDKNKFKTSVVFAPSETGDLIPISIIEKKDRKGPSKLLLKVYGFYGLENQVEYGNVYLGALENDWVIAYAHVRGGNELGNKWWKSAILENKSRAWKDLKQCVGYLFAHQYTHPSLLVLSGSSAGAITVWNAINHNPYLYKAAILSFPFLDVLNSLLDIKSALTGIDYSEFGNPTESLKTFNAIQSYCPYQTIKNQQYPAIFIEAGSNDYRCPLYQTLKFIQRFRQRAKIPTRIDEIGDKGLIVSIHKETSHTGSADGLQKARNECQIFGYLDYVLLEANKDLTYK